MAPPKNNPSKGGRGRFSPYSQEARVKSKSPEIKAEDNEEQATANPNLDVPALPQERPMVSVRAQRAQLQATIERYRTEAAEAAERMTEAERIMAELNGEIDMLNRVEANLRAEARAGDKAFNDMMIAADLANGRRRAAERTVEEQREEIEELNQALDTLIVERNALNEHVTRLDTRGQSKAISLQPYLLTLDPLLTLMQEIPMVASFCRHRRITTGSLTRHSVSNTRH